MNGSRTFTYAEIRAATPADVAPCTRCKTQPRNHPFRDSGVVCPEYVGPPKKEKRR